MKYSAFISYSQKDISEARKLQRWLENFRNPDQSDRTNLKPFSSRVFRDETDLSAAPHVWDALAKNIEQSKFLIVLCSPQAARSRWVDREIKHFRASGRARGVFAVILSGTPNAIDADEECFPPSFRTHEGGTEPLAVDIRAGGLKKAFIRLTAGLLDQSFDDLWQRERRRRNRIAAVTASIISAFAFLGAGASYLAVEEFAQTREKEQLIDFYRERAATISNELGGDEFAEPEECCSLPKVASVDSRQPLKLARIKPQKKVAIEIGQAKVYGDGFQGQLTALGEDFDEGAFTAAHPTLPLPSLVRVRNEINSREVVVRVNDRGPFDGGHIIELSPASANRLAIPRDQSAIVKVEYLGPAPVRVDLLEPAPDTPKANVEFKVLSEVSSPQAVAEPSQVQPIYFSRASSEYSRDLPASENPIKDKVDRLTEQHIELVDSGNLSEAALIQAEINKLLKPTELVYSRVGAPGGGRQYFVVVGEYQDISIAQTMSMAIGRGLPVKIEEARIGENNRVPPGDYFRVMVGPYSSREPAQAHESMFQAIPATREAYLTER